MSETEIAVARVPDAGGGTDAAGDANLGILLAGLMTGAGVIHLVMVPAHAGGSSWLDPVAFAVVGWVQLGLAAAFLLRRGGRNLTIVSIAVNAVVLGLWVWSRTAGLPVGSHAGIVEETGLVDGICALLEAAALLVGIAMVAAPSRLRVGVLGPSLAAVAVLGLASVAVVSPDASSFGHGSGDGNAAHDHSGNGSDPSAGDHITEMAALDEQRCDLGFNPRSYWEEGPLMGVDTYTGGAMAPHASGSLADLAAEPDAFEGRGSLGLDQLISATSQANTGGEGAAAALIGELSDASEDDYDAWVAWMKSTAVASSGGGSSGGHAHGSSGASAAAPDDNGGHGGHTGPQPWKAMVDQEQCVQLSEELVLARETALKYPTAADAMAAGWVRVTRYVPGIAAHYMNFGLVDGEFQIDEPEMILYDGNEPTARVVGLSYYMLMSGDAEPTQGFTGGNDHFHRHVGLCTKAGAGVIGDSTTTAEECAARGGVKADGTGGWMSHAWVVPGCESPWGVFSGASPLLDPALATSSGTDGGACAASGVRDRYDLRPGGKAASSGAGSGTGETADGD